MLIKIQNTVVHCNHAVRSRRKDNSIDLMGFRFADQVSDRTVADHDFKCSHNAAVYSRNKLLRNNGLKYHGKLNADLCLLVWRESVNDSVDCAGSADGVQGGEDQMTGLSCG